MIKKFGVYCETEGVTKEVWSVVEPSLCPTDGGHVLRSGSARVMKNGKFYQVIDYDSVGVEEGKVVSINPAGECVLGFGLPPKNEIFESNTLSVVTCVLASGKVVFGLVHAGPNDVACDGLLCVGAKSGQMMHFCENKTPFSADIATKNIAVAATGGECFVVVWKSSAGVKCSKWLVSELDVFTKISEGTVSNDVIDDAMGNLVAREIGAGRILFAYCEKTGSERGKYRVGDFSSEPVIWGSEYVFNGGQTSRGDFSLSCGVIDATKFVILFGADSALKAAIVTSTGQTLSTLTVNSDFVDIAQHCDLVKISAAKFLVLFRRNSDKNTHAYCVMVTVGEGDVLAGGATVQITKCFGTFGLRGLNIGNYVIVSYFNDKNGTAELSVLNIAGADPALISAGKIFNYQTCWMTMGEVSGGFYVCYRDLFDEMSAQLTIGEIDGAGKINLYNKKGLVVAGVISKIIEGNICELVGAGQSDVFEGLDPGEEYFAHGSGMISLMSNKKNNNYRPAKIGVALSADIMNLMFQ